MIKGKKTNKLNIICLGISYELIVMIYLIIAFQPSTIEKFNLNNIFVYNLNFVAFLLIIYFVNQTFYQNRKSPVKYIQTITFLIFIAIIVTEFLEPPQIDISNYRNNRIFGSVFLIIWHLVPLLWLGKSCFNAAESLKESGVSPWIYKRTRICGYSAYFLSIHLIPDLLRMIFEPISQYGQFNTFWESFASFSSIICLLIFTISQFRLWIMPQGFKNFSKSPIEHNGDNIQSQFTEKNVDHHDDLSQDNLNNKEGNNIDAL